MSKKIVDVEWDQFVSARRHETPVQTSKKPVLMEEVPIHGPSLGQIVAEPSVLPQTIAAPAPRPLRISTQSRIASFVLPTDQLIPIEDLFWKLPIDPYYRPTTGVLCKQTRMKFYSPDALEEMQKKLVGVPYYEEVVIRHIDNTATEYNPQQPQTQQQQQQVLVFQNQEKKEEEEEEGGGVRYYRRKGKRSYARMNNPLHQKSEQGQGQGVQEEKQWNPNGNEQVQVQKRQKGQQIEEEEMQNKEEKEEEEGQKEENDKKEEKEEQMQGKKEEKEEKEEPKKKRSRISYLDVRKISVGMTKSTIRRMCIQKRKSKNVKSKNAFINCIALTMRIEDDTEEDRCLLTTAQQQQQKEEEQEQEKKKTEQQQQGPRQLMFREVHAKLFNTGKVKIPGMQSEAMYNRVVNQLLQVLLPLVPFPMSVHGPGDIILTNSNFTLNYEINRSVADYILRTKYDIFSVYDPCNSYTGITCKYYYNTWTKKRAEMSEVTSPLPDHILSVSFMIFRTGSVLIVGKCDVNVLLHLYEFLCHVFQQEHHLIAETQE